MVAVSRSLLWQCAVSCSLLVALGLMITGIRVDPGSATPLLMTVLPMALIAPFRPWAAKLAPVRLLDTLECVALLSLLVAVGAVASYLVALTTTGWVDDRLISIDRAMGFDWRAAYGFVAARPMLRGVAKLAYLSIFTSPTLVLIVLAWTGRAPRARAFIAAHTLALVVTLVIFWWFPARSALLATVGSDPAYMPTTGIGHVAVIEALRAGKLTSIDLAHLFGLITFPSFHAASALLVIWAVYPLRFLRIPIIALNLGMLLATPVEGTHYLIDVIGGLGVAVLAIASLYLLPAMMRARLEAPAHLQPA